MLSLDKLEHLQAPEVQSLGVLARLEVAINSRTAGLDQGDQGDQGDPALCLRLT